MTITNSNHYEEIVGKLQKNGIEIAELILIVTKDNLSKWLDKRGNSTKYAYQQIDRCIECFNSNFKGQEMNPDENDIDVTIAKILSLLDEYLSVKNGLYITRRDFMNLKLLPLENKDFEVFKRDLQKSF